jgi:putative membrane protein
MGTRGSGTPGGDTASSGSTAGTTGATGTTGTSSSGASSAGSGTGAPGSDSASPPSTPGKSSSLDSRIVGANVQLAADTATTPAGAKLTRADKEFIEEAASGGLAEVEVGKMMSERAKHPEVKQFAEMLVKDHTAANEELRRIAASSGVSLPPTPETKHRMMIERLANEKGGDVDRTFIRTFGVKEHEQDIKAFQKQAETGDSPQLKAFAAKTLPKLQEHLAIARKLESELAK